MSPDTFTFMWIILIALLVPATILVWVVCAVAVKEFVEMWRKKP